MEKIHGKLLLVNFKLIVENSQHNFGVESLGIIVENKNQSINKQLL
jgi:hypothetical protein